MTPRADVLGCSIDRIDMRETVARVEEMILAGRYSQHMAINTAKLVSLATTTGFERSSRAASWSMPTVRRSSGLRAYSATPCRNGLRAST